MSTIFVVRSAEATVRRTMRRLRGFDPARERRRAGALALVLIALVAGCARDRGEVVTAKVGDLTLEVTPRTDPPRQGKNVIDLAVKDSAGRPLDGAEVEMVVTMPAMPGMPEMRSRAGIEPSSDGRYRGELDVATGGTWTLDVAVRSSAGNGKASYSFTVGAKGLQLTGASRSPQSAAHGDADVAYYSCSMHTHVRSEVPGTCPICSMDLAPVTEQEVESGEIVVDAARRQTIGVRTGRVERRPLRHEVRAVGKVTIDETRLTEVSVKYPGWIGRLDVNATGQPVRRGQTLFTMYSPELYAAQGEYLAALESQRRARVTAAPDRADYLVEASLQRLRLWDMRDEDLDLIAATGEPIKYLPFVSPASGHVVEKNVVQGGAVETGRTLYRIASLDRVWVEGEVYESDLVRIAVGQRATVTLPNLPGRRLDGRVAFIYPYLDDASRTGRVRIELANPGLELKPAMYADVVLEVERGEAVMVPESAVLYAGQRRLVFLDLGGGRLRPRAIEVGVESGDWLEVLAGLEEGDAVVTSGTFLVAAESRLKSGTEQWE